jgi:hypothetical protein
MVARFDDVLLARQLEETLLEAGFTKQEISINSWGEDTHFSRLQAGRLEATPEICYLTVQTKTQLDEDLATAVFRDCGVRGRRVVESKPLLSTPSTYKKNASVSSLSK